MKKDKSKRKYDRPKKFIPIRYIFFMVTILLETLFVILSFAFLTFKVPYFYIFTILLYILSIIFIVDSNDNPDYKVPWLIIVILVPFAGFGLYLIFYKRNLNKLQKTKLKILMENHFNYDDSESMSKIEIDKPIVSSLVKELKCGDKTHIYQNTITKYFSVGEEMFTSLLGDLLKAENFIFMEYFIIQEGIFFDSIYDILKKKAKEGVEIKLIYDDAGCMKTLPKRLIKDMKKNGISVQAFGKINTKLNNHFNNRTHRKITVIDGKYGYVGGINLADEYINHTERFGHWKDTGLRLEGLAVNELTRIFITDFEYCTKKQFDNYDNYFINYKVESKNNYLIPFCDGPKPVFNNYVSKNAIIEMLSQAKDYVYITTPYLIPDTELTNCIIRASQRGVDVRIITPHIPDKKIIFYITRSYYERLIETGVKIYEYKPGFIHSKIYLSDDTLCIIGSINLDYRSLAHNFENGVLLINDSSIIEIKNDLIKAIDTSICINDKNYKEKDNIIKKTFRTILKIFAPLL